MPVVKVKIKMDKSKLFADVTRYSVTARNCGGNRPEDNLQEIFGVLHHFPVFFCISKIVLRNTCLETVYYIRYPTTAIFTDDLTIYFRQMYLRNL